MIFNSTVFKLIIGPAGPNESNYYYSVLLNEYRSNSAQVTAVDIIIIIRVSG